MPLIAAACAGFLVAVLWMDLMFDSQVLRHRDAEVIPEAVLASISAYYRRATTSVLATAPILLAMLRTVPSAVRLGARTGDAAEQSRLARSICVDHVVCLVFLLGFLAVWLTLAG